MVTHMKTIIEIPDELFQSAKLRAASQNTTLKNLIEGALRREIYPFPEPDPHAVYEIDADGIPTLKPRGKKITSKFIYDLLDETEPDS